MSLPGGNPTPEPYPSAVIRDLDPTGLQWVRAAVRSVLSGHSGVTVEDAVLMVEELASNAVRHGQGPRCCRIALINRGRCLRVEVDDTSPNPPRIRTPDATGGRGLRLVDQLASAWGVRHHDRHKTVWAELTVTGRGGHARYVAPAPDWPQSN